MKLHQAPASEISSFYLYEKRYVMSSKWNLEQEKECDKVFISIRYLHPSKWTSAVIVFLRTLNISLEMCDGENTKSGRAYMDWNMYLPIS